MKAHRWTTDLLVVVVLTLSAVFAVLIADVEWTPVRIALLLPLVLFLPGYVLVGVFYPQSSASGSRTEGRRGYRSGKRGIDGVERLGLSLAASLAVVPLLAFALNFSPAGIRPVPLLLAVSWFTLVFAFLALVRRFGVPPDQRFRIPSVSGVSGLTSRYFGAGEGSSSEREPFEAVTGTPRLLNLLLVASFLVLAGSVALAAVAPAPGDEAFTEFYLVTGNESVATDTESGEFDAIGPSGELAAGRETSLSVAIENHEGEQITYTTIVELQETRVEDGRVLVDDERELERFETSVAPGATEATEVTVTPGRGGEDLQLVFLLYRDAPPDDPSRENAYRETHLTVRSGAG